MLCENRFLLLFAASFLLVQCSVKTSKRPTDPREISEAERKPLDIYIHGNDFGFGAIVYTENYGQSSNKLFLDDEFIGITSYPFSRQISKAGEESKYRFYRIVEKDTIRMQLGGTGSDSTLISSTIPTSMSSSEMKHTYFYLRFYAGSYPERPKGVDIDSTEIGQWENRIRERLEKLDAEGILPQVNRR